VKSEDPIYFQPSDLFDPAIIRINEDNRVEYDQDQLRSILANQYYETISSMSNYKQAGEHEKRRRADRLACKWLIAMRDAAIFGSLTKRPLIVKENK
jgi:hypothetical protein